MKEVLKFQSQKIRMQYSTMYMLKSKLQIEKIKDSAIWTKLIILKKLHVTHKQGWFLYRTF